MTSYGHVRSIGHFRCSSISSNLLSYSLNKIAVVLISLHKQLQLILGITEDIYSLGLCQRSLKSNLINICTYLGQLNLTSTAQVSCKCDLVVSRIVDERDIPFRDWKCRLNIK